MFTMRRSPTLLGYDAVYSNIIPDMTIGAIRITIATVIPVCLA